MKKISFFICLLFLFASFDAKQKHMINWKKVKTKTQALSEMDKYIHAGDDKTNDYDFLNNEKHDYLGLSGDSVIYFNSPELGAGFMISRKWMYTFHYENNKLSRYDVEEGLTGP